MEKTAEKLNIKGKITIRGYKKGTLAKIAPLMLELQGMLSQKSAQRGEISKLRARIQGILKIGQVQQISNHNLIIQAANCGTDLIIQNLNGFLATPVCGLAINYISIGTGQTTPANSDTQLTTESARSVVVDSMDIGYNELQLQAFFPDSALPNATYYEAGSFIGGTSTPNSGTIFNHALFATPYVKTPGLDTTVQITISL